MCKQKLQLALFLRILCVGRSMYLWLWCVCNQCAWARSRQFARSLCPPLTSTRFSPLLRTHRHANRVRAAGSPERQQPVRVLHRPQRSLPFYKIRTSFVLQWILDLFVYNRFPIESFILILDLFHKQHGKINIDGNSKNQYSESRTASIYSFQNFYSSKPWSNKKLLIV